MNKRFKAGEKVRVLNARGMHRYIAVGQIHVVTGRNGFDNLTLDGHGDVGFADNRFELVEPAKPREFRITSVGEFGSATYETEQAALDVASELFLPGESFSIVEVINVKSYKVSKTLEAL